LFCYTDAPDGNVTISSNITGQIEEWMAAVLACHLPGGNPRATLTWSCKGQTIASLNFSNVDEAIQKLEVTFDRSYDKKTCVCTAMHPLLIKDLFAEIIFSVYCK